MVITNMNLIFAKNHFLAGKTQIDKNIENFFKHTASLQLVKKYC